LSASTNVLKSVQLSFNEDGCMETPNKAVCQ